MIVATLLTLPAAMAEDAWYPAEIDVWSPPFNTKHQHTLQQYMPPSHASRAWRICASIPHLKDDYWLAVNFGLVNEAKQLGVALNLYEAGGYGARWAETLEAEIFLFQEPVEHAPGKGTMRSTSLERQVDGSDLV